MRIGNNKVYEKDGGLYDEEGKPIVDVWTGEQIGENALYAKGIGGLVDMIMQNMHKNILDPIRNAEKNYTLRSTLPLIYSKVMSNIWTSSGIMTVGELAKTLRMTNSNLTPELNKMEAEGYIYREISKTNRRCVDVFLTEKGMSILADFQYKMDPFWEKLLVKTLNSDELADMYEAMCKINYYLNRLDPQHIAYRTAAEKFFEEGNVEDFEFIYDGEAAMPEVYKDKIAAIKEKLRAARSESGNK